MTAAAYCRRAAFGIERFVGANMVDGGEQVQEQDLICGLLEHNRKLLEMMDRKVETDLNLTIVDFSSEGSARQAKA